jgi:hypothetical protein
VTLEGVVRVRLTPADSLVTVLTLAEGNIQSLYRVLVTVSTQTIQRNGRRRSNKDDHMNNLILTSGKIQISLTQYQS